MISLNKMNYTFSKSANGKYTVCVNDMDPILFYKTIALFRDDEISRSPLPPKPPALTSPRSVCSSEMSYKSEIKVKPEIIIQVMTGPSDPDPPVTPEPLSMNGPPAPEPTPTKPAPTKPAPEPVPKMCVQTLLRDRAPELEESSVSKYSKLVMDMYLKLFRVREFDPDYLLRTANVIDWINNSKYTPAYKQLYVCAIIKLCSVLSTDPEPRSTYEKFRDELQKERDVAQSEKSLSFEQILTTDMYIAVLESLKSPSTLGDYTKNLIANLYFTDPMRREWGTVQLTDTKDNNYLNVNTGELTLRKYKNVKKLGVHKRVVNPGTMEILRDYLNFRVRIGHKSNFLFTSVRFPDRELGVNNMGKMITKMFQDVFPESKITVNSIRKYHTSLVYDEEYEARYGKMCDKLMHSRNTSIKFYAK